jgi:hypothetical protein
MNETLISVVVGFLLGYLSFEIREWRRRRIRHEATRRALLAELEAIEVILSQMVIVLSIGTDNAARAVQEMRRLSSEDLADVLLIGQQQPSPGFLERSDQELAEILQTWRPMKNPVGAEVETPVLNAALASVEFYPSRAQLKALIAVRWHTSLLAHHREWMNQWLRMTFEVGDDPENLEIVLANHADALRSYKVRVEVMLGAVREALERLQDHP